MYRPERNQIHAQSCLVDGQASIASYQNSKNKSDINPTFNQSHTIYAMLSYVVYHPRIDVLEGVVQ